MHNSSHREMVNNDLIDEMVEPTQQDHDSDQEQQQQPSDGSESEPIATAEAPPLANGQTAEVKPEDDRLAASTSLYCSLPLNRDVQSILDTFSKSGDPERKKTRKLPCLYCERTFVADSLRQKHIERCHSVKQARRSSSRFQQAGVANAVAGGGVVIASITSLQCQFCDAFQPAAGDDDLSDLFRHLVGEHADRYFACVACRERFVLKTHLDEHREEEHAIKREHVDAADVTTLLDADGRASKAFNHKSKKDFKDLDEAAGDLTPAAKEEKVFGEQKELRSKKAAIKSTKLGTKRSARLQNKETPPPTPTSKISSASSTTSSTSSTTSTRKKSKAKEVVVPEAVERETLKVGIHENPYPTFDAFYRVKKITDHSIDNLRITSLTFNDVFDQAFFTRIKCNIADNLQNHIDGKLFKNEESESRISNFEKTQADVNAAENHYGCEISLHAATPVASFPAPQLGDDPEAQIEYASKASKKKPKPDEVHYKYFTRRKYQASIQEIKENRDLSKLDMWTQYVVKNRQQAIANTARSEKERQDYKRGVEYRAKVQNEELNRILDRRGPFEDLRLEANKQAALDGNRSREARVEASCALEDVLQRVFDLAPPPEVVCATGAKTELTDAEIPGYLNLRRASLVAGDAHVDRSDKITLICSSEETENFEAPQVSPRDKHALVELSGEWTRSRLFICAACGMRLANMRALIDHKNIVHQNVWCQHYEFVGKQGAFYRHLSIPGLGKMDLVEDTPAVKSWQRSVARQCTKCKKMCNTLGELHRHILECGEDWSWMLIRKKCKYRPYGAKTRRKRRGLIKRHESSKKENKEKKTYKRTDRPREKPSDAETIQRMLANLPAKRATRTEMSLKDGFPKASSKKKKEVTTHVKNKKMPKSRAEQLIQDSSAAATLVKRKVMVANKCNPVNNVRKSVRNINKVISSALIDNNIMVRRKLKALQASRATRARTTELPEAPLDLTEEQRAEEVKKKISLFKKVQKFRRSVIKRRTTKASSSSSAESLHKLADAAGPSNRVPNAQPWRKTRSASNLTDSSGASPPSDKQAKSPSRKKLRSNFGAKLLRTLSMRRRRQNKKDDETVSTSSASTSNAPEEKRKRFAGIKKVVKKLKVATQTKRRDKKVVPEVDESKESASVTSTEHFLEEGIHANAIRTISEVDKRDNDNRPLAIAPLSDRLDPITDGMQREAQNANETNDELPTVPIVTITPADDDVESAKVTESGIAFNETLEVEISSLDATESIAPTGGCAGGQLVSPLPSLPSLSPLLGGNKAKSKLCKRAKGLNDCIAMLTSKLQCQSDVVPLAVHSPVTKESVPPPLLPTLALPLPVPQQSDAPIVVVTPHDTTTEEQNVVIPEEMVSENLESAKEPEAAPPSPPLPIRSAPAESTAPATLTAITINDLSTPVIEQDKENIEMEQKTLLPAMKQAYDVTLEKVVDLIKCFEDIHPKEIRNGHVDHKVDVINGLKGLPKKAPKQAARKIGAQRKTPKQRAFVVQEQLNIARLEEDLILNDFERKMGSRRSLPQRKTKKTFVDLKIPEIRLKDRGQPKSVPKINLSTILEEPRLLAESTFALEKCAADKSQVMSEPSSQMPRAVHTVQHILHAAEKEELPVDLSVTKKADLPEVSLDDVPVDLSTKKTTTTAPPLEFSVFLTTNCKNVEIIHGKDDIPTVKIHLTSSKLETKIENEPIVLEKKDIPQPQTPQKESHSGSESEDELPLAALLKSIGPIISQKPSNADSEEIRLCLSNETSHNWKHIPEHKDISENNLKNLSFRGCVNSISEEIVISDEEPEPEEKPVIDECKTANIATNMFILQDAARKMDVKLPQGLTATHLQCSKVTIPITLPSVTVESVVCTPDLGYTPEVVPMQKQVQDILTNQTAEEIDFEDVIPVASISPPEPIKHNTTTPITGKNNGVTLINDRTPVSRMKRGRKAKNTKTVTNTTEIDVSLEEQVIESAFKIPEELQKVPENVSVADTTQEIQKAIEEVIQEDVSTISTCIDNEKVEAPVAENKTGKGIITLKTRKAGRPKSKRKKVTKTKKLKDADTDLSPIAAEEEVHVENTATCLTTTTLTEDVNTLDVPIIEEGHLQETCEILDNSGDLTPTKTKKKLKVKAKKGKIMGLSEDCPVEELTEQEQPVIEEVIKISSEANIEPQPSIDEEPLLIQQNLEVLQTTPKKVTKAKRGRKPRARNITIDSEVSPEVIGDNEDTNISTSSLVVTTETTTRSLRKRKSDEFPIPAPPPSTVSILPEIVTTPATTLTTPTAAQFQLSDGEPKKSIAIYDFDEEDECTGDNSKENMEQLKPKSNKRSKRNGHSPAKAPAMENDENSKVNKSITKLDNAAPENMHEEANTPLKDMQNESFIQTPDLNDSALATKIVNRFKVKKGKNSKAKKIPIENVQEHYCDICNKQFGRLDSLNKHKRTLTHIAKLSEIEALEAEAKKRQSEINNVEACQEDGRQEEKEEIENRQEMLEAVGHTLANRCLDVQRDVNMTDKDVEPAATTPEEDLKQDAPKVDNGDVKDLNAQLDDVGILSPCSEFMRARSHSDVAKSLLVTSPFSLKTNNDSLRLADIISDVLNKPVEGMETYADAEKLALQEPKRYKSLGERKSFDSDSYTPTPAYNISPASTLINKTTSDEFLKNQLSLLENIIEENKASFEYMDEASVQSIGSDKSDRCPSDMSLVSDIKEDSSRIISYNDELNFVQPNLQYEEISEDSVNNRNYEQERSRKTLNRDEELFLECCSLLKSSSEVGDGKKSRVPLPEDVKHRSADICEHDEDLDRKLEINDDDFMSDSCPNTPIGDTFDDFSNSDTMKTDWSSAKMNDKEYEDISQDTRGEDSFKSFNFKLDSKSDIDESSNSVDFRKNINAKFVGLMAEAMRGKPPRRRRQKTRERRKSDTTQTSIIDYAVQLTPKSSSNSTDNFTDLTNDSKKVMTKGAMKVFEGLKVSIPTDEIDMNQVLDCSPTSKRLEIEETTKNINKNKGLNFGNKLGLKVTKKRNAATRRGKPEEFISESDKIHDVYDFEETQDNTDLFSATSRNFRNGSALCEKDDEVITSLEGKNKKAKLIEEIIESESESNNQDFDLFGAEVQSVNSFSTETESSASIKPPSVTTTQENITKKKCQIMGRIFKNAFKAKVDGTKETTPVDDGDVLEKYIIGGPLEEIATPPPEKSPVTKERPKMSEKEMDLLFDKLLQGKADQQAAKSTTKTAEKPHTTAQKERIDVDEEPTTVENVDKDVKDSKTKKTTPKSVKTNRRRSRKHSESSDDEFNLTKSPKKRQARKSKPRDNGINMDEEIKQCMGVAGRKSQRKCTSGKQNVLIEYWSSDDSEFEAMLRLSMQESGLGKSKDEHVEEVRPRSENTRMETQVDTKFESPKDISKRPMDDEVVEEFEEAPKLDMSTDITTTSAVPKTKTKRSGSSTKNRGEGRESKAPRAPKAKHPRVPRSAQDEATLAANRRKRAAVDTLYYWSSSSEDDTQNLIAVKSARDEIDDEEDRPQHGWIVGDSPKKLVTLLAHAKGKKTNR